MNFYKGELKSLDLGKMKKYILEKRFICACNNGISSKLCIDKNVNIENLLKKYNELYCFFGERNDQYLSCANGENYLVDDERSKNSEGIYMADAYFNKYEHITLGFLLEYNDGIVEIKPAIEGEASEGRMYEVVENCGDIYGKMKAFVNKFII